MQQAEGGYSFLPSAPGAPFSGGVVASPGHEVVRATFARTLPWQQAFATIERHLREEGRPRAALCALELRCAEPYTREGFGAFNAQYRALLESWGILVDGNVPAARSNVAPVVRPPAEQSIYAFHYTVPAQGTAAPPTFFLSGAAETPTVRPGEASEDALREKTADVLANLQRRLDQIPATWDDVTAVAVYTPHAIPSLLEASVLNAVGGAARHGLHWFDCRPPVQGLDVEIDTRRERRELFLVG